MNRPFIYAPPASPQLNILFEDANILVLDKPSGLLTVAGNRPELADCLEVRAQTHTAEARIVHRLDKDTSGVIILGKTAEAHANLGLQFEKRRTEKTYVACVWGVLAAKNGSIDLPIATDWPNRPCQRVDHENGRNAVTHWRVLAKTTNTTRVQLTPLTGRTHQLRVHMLALGHPILGDNLYAPDDAFHAAERLQLHAETLRCFHPKTGEQLTFTTPCPF